jgi:general secretion pathway protein D
MTMGRTNPEKRRQHGRRHRAPLFRSYRNDHVSVPDGGTVLLGGIKRLSEGRNEFGVPLLSKVPYINRLFKNVSIGRDTDSLMMMVTPRIIIQEEEEERLGIATP